MYKLRRLTYLIKVVSIVLLYFFIILAGGCKDLNKTHEEKAIEKQIEKEFKQIFSLNTNTIDLSSLSLFGIGGLEVKNKSTLNWDKMFIILNPPTPPEGNNDNGFQIAKSLFDYAVFNLTNEGFRAPSETDKIYKNISPNESLKISWDKFIHTKTKEKFSVSRYELTTVFIHVSIIYKGITFEESEIFKMSPKKD